jgi:large subunit ribosomal protein L22
MEARAISRYQRISVKKANRLLELIRGKNAKEALNILYFLQKPKHKVPILKALKSAIANAIYKAGKVKLKEEDLYVKEARVTPGPMLKRWQAGPMGRAMMIRRRTSHIYITVATIEENKKGEE